MKIRAMFQRMLRMQALSWEVLLRCLQLCCFLLFCTALLLIAYEGNPLRHDLYIQARAMNEYAQTALLFAVLLPPILEDLKS